MRILEGLGRISIAAAVTLLMGAGCDLSTKISWQSPFSFTRSDSSDPEAVSKGLALQQGFSATIQPSFMGVTGTVADLAGSKAGVREAVVTETDGGSNMAIKWSGDGMTGDIRTSGFGEAEAMLLPAFWKEGETSVERNGLLWLSREAYGELATSGATEWRLGLADEKLAVAANLLKMFNAISDKLSGRTASATATTPFTLTKSGETLAFPLRVDGKIESLAAIKASSWFADYLILKNPENPLILKVSVNPLALEALEKLTPLGVDPKGVGYEIVAVTLPKAK